MDHSSALFDPLESYFYEIRGYKLLGPEETKELAIKALEEDDWEAPPG
jgi:hypothetical protein